MYIQALYESKRDITLSFAGNPSMKCIFPWESTVDDAFSEPQMNVAQIVRHIFDNTDAVAQRVYSIVSTTWKYAGVQEASLSAMDARRDEMLLGYWSSQCGSLHASWSGAMMPLLWPSAHPLCIHETYVQGRLSRNMEGADNWTTDHLEHIITKICPV